MKYEVKNFFFGSKITAYILKSLITNSKIKNLNYMETYHHMNIQKKYFKLLSDQKIKYLLIGSYNALIGYLLFILVFYHFSSTVNHYLLLGICHLIGISHNFFSYGLFVFKLKLKPSKFRSYLKFNSVYIFTFILNVILFSLLTKTMNWNLYFSQALIVFLLAIVGYILNKYYSFK